MKILIASNPHKGFASSRQIGLWLQEGILETLPEAELRIVSIGDGGEGTIESLLEGIGGDLLSVSVHDPLFHKRTATIGILSQDPKTAVLEISQACGSLLLAPHERNTMTATSYGVGEMIQASLDTGCRRIIVGLGGCIASDGGLGMAQALGAQFYNAAGNRLPSPSDRGLNVQDLVHIARMDTSAINRRLREIEVLVASDVNSNLLGPQGQAQTFGPQKGASPQQIQEIERSLTHWDKLLARTFHRSFDVPYAGAAGGLGAGLAAFVRGELGSGSELILNRLDFESHLTWADVVVVGEGKLDRTTWLEKAPHIISNRAKRLGKRVIGAVGLLEDPLWNQRRLIDAVFEVGEMRREKVKACGADIGKYLA